MLVFELVRQHGMLSLEDVHWRLSALPAVREKLQGQGMEILGGTPAQFAEVIRSETERWGRIVRAAGAKAN